MGGVYAVVYMSFEYMQDMGCVRISSPCPDPDRQDAGQGCGNACVNDSMFSDLGLPGFFVLYFYSCLLMGCNATQKGRH